MIPTRQSAAALCAATLAAGLGLVAAPAVAAPAVAAPAVAPDAASAPAPDRRDASERRDGPEHGPGGPRDDFGPPGPGAPGPGMPFAHPHGVALSEDQQDQLFAIMHAQAPQRRALDKTIRKAAQALRELGRAEPFDDARAVALSRELGQALGAEALLRARTQAKVGALLTPQQREEQRQRFPRPRAIR